MYLAQVTARNFRLFGDRTGDGEPKKQGCQHSALSISFSKGLNVLVGENDCGKTALIDAIRFCLWTTSQDFHRFRDEDFHTCQAFRTDTLTIRCKFVDLSREDKACFLEWLTTDKTEPPCLYVTTKVTRIEREKAPRIWVETHSGEEGEGPALEGLARELVRSTYLKPLRDAESELSPGRNSRLSRILASHPEIVKQELNDFSEETDEAETLVGIVRRADFHIGKNQAIAGARDDINDNYLSRLQLGSERLASDITVAGDVALARILEKLELTLANNDPALDWTRRGLGMHNALFMSAELLLLGTNDAIPTLLIEEPEAHLHPQLQLRVVDLLKNEPPGHQGRSVQSIITTHSPNLASTVPLECIVYMAGGRTYSLARHLTCLGTSDYSFLERFLDVTKANLFFARAVIIVEGDAEALLIPTMAARCGLSFGQQGISVVSVGHVGLFRYSRIFQRKDGSSMPVRVACIRDRDLVPDEVPDDMAKASRRRRDLTDAQREDHLKDLQSLDGGCVRTFVSDFWTLEYDLARASWAGANLMAQAVACASKSSRQALDEETITEIRKKANDQICEWQKADKKLEESANAIFKPLRLAQISKAITAQFAADILADATFAMNVEDLPQYLQKAFSYLAEGE